MRIIGVVKAPFVTNIIILLGASAVSCLGLIDLDNDGLDDVWQERFGAGDLLPDGDEDGDGLSNVDECIIGSDPFDPGDVLDFESQTVEESGALLVTWQTEPGKAYQMEVGSTPANDDFSFLGPVLQGTGESIAVRVQRMLCRRSLAVCFTNFG